MRRKSATRPQRPACGRHGLRLSMFETGDH